MQPVSQKFLAAISTSHKIAVRIEVWGGTAGKSNLVYVYDPVSNYVPEGPALTQGSVSMDKQSPIRSQFNLTFVDPSGILIPTDPVTSSILNPFGNEMVIYRGVDYQDNTAPEYVKLGTFRISKVVPNETDGGVTIAVSGYSRERIVSRNLAINFWPPFNLMNAQFVDPAASPLWKPVTYAEYIRILIADRYPAALFNDTLTSWINQQNDGLNVHVDPAVKEFLTDGEDPFQHCYNLARATGCALACDRNGVFNFYRDPAFTFTAATDPAAVYSFVEGESVFFSNVERTVTDETAFNRYVVIGVGQNLSAPLRSDIADPANPVSIPADDTDPNSPTYVNGPYGVVASVITNSYMHTSAQVRDYAQLLLRSTIGGQQEVTFSHCNPALDIDDTLMISRSRLGLVNKLYALDNITIPLTIDQLPTGRLRERRAISQ